MRLKSTPRHRRPRVTNRPFSPLARGYHAAYREGETNHCPGCGRTHWYVGRVSAECAFCSTALPLENSFSQEKNTVPTFTSRGAGHGRVR